MADFANMMSNPDSVMLTQLFSALNETLAGSPDWKGILRTLSRGTLKLISTLLIHRLFLAGDMSSLIRAFLIRIVYRKMMLSPKNPREQEVVEIYKSMTTNEAPIVTVSGMPIYLEREGDRRVIYSCPILHAPFVNGMLHAADIAVAESEVIETVCEDASGNAYTPLDLFASNNYLKLDHIISRYFAVHASTSMVTPPIIVLNGAPGLGKSHSSHFLANQGKYGKIKHISLTSPNMATVSFSSIVSGLTSKRATKSIIIYFDELDKYVEMYTQHAFTKAQKYPSSMASYNMDEVVDGDFTTFARSVKKSIVLTISELNNNFCLFPKGVVFIFCSNNFHTLFDDVNTIHLESVKTRFTFIEFEMCGKEEFMRYIRSFTEKVSVPELKYSEEELVRQFSRIDDNLLITYRTIQILHAVSAYELDTLITKLNEHIDSPPSAPLTVSTSVPSPISALPKSQHIPQPTQENKTIIIPAISIHERILKCIRNNSMNGEQCLNSTLEIAPYPVLIGEIIQRELLTEIIRNGRVELLKHIAQNTRSAISGLMESVIRDLSDGRFVKGKMRLKVYDCVDELIAIGEPLTNSIITCNLITPVFDNEEDLARILQWGRLSLKYTENATDLQFIYALVKHSKVYNTIRELLNMGYTMNKSNWQTYTLYYEVLLHGSGDTQLIDLLISHGMDTNIPANMESPMCVLLLRRSSNVEKTIKTMKYMKRVGLNMILQDSNGKVIDVSDLTKSIELQHAYRNL